MEDSVNSQQSQVVSSQPHHKSLRTSDCSHQPAAKHTGDWRL